MRYWARPRPEHSELELGHGRTSRSRACLRPCARRSSPGTWTRRSPTSVPELRRNLGEVLALLPLPSVEAGVDSIERGGSGFVVVLRLVGESEEVLIQTRWKDREGEPTMIELSHLSKTETAPPVGGDETEADGGEASAV